MLNQEDPNFFNFRLEELDEELRRGGKTGDAQPADGSGDSEDPQQVHFIQGVPKKLFKES